MQFWHGVNGLLKRGSGLFARFWLSEDKARVRRMNQSGLMMTMTVIFMTKIKRSVKVQKGSKICNAVTTKMHERRRRAAAAAAAAATKITT